MTMPARRIVGAGTRKPGTMDSEKTPGTAILFVIPIGMTGW
jgi:hypothetical protein